MNKPHRFIHETGHQVPLDELPMDDQYNARYMAQWERDEMGVPPPGAVEPIDEELQPYLDELGESTGETGYPWGYIPAPLYNEETHFTTGEPMDLTWRLLKEENIDEGQLTNEDLFEGLLHDHDLMHYSEMTDRQKAIIDAKANLMPHLFTEGSEMGENMNRFLFSRSIHESIPDHYYEDELKYLNHYQDAMNALFPNNEYNHDKTIEITDNGYEEHPEHPHAVAMSQMRPSFANRQSEVRELYNLIKPSDDFNLDFQEDNKSEPMDIAWRLLKDESPDFSQSPYPEGSRLAWEMTQPDPYALPPDKQQEVDEGRAVVHQQLVNLLGTDYSDQPEEVKSVLDEMQAHLDDAKLRNMDSASADDFKHGSAGRSEQYNRLMEMVKDKIMGYRRR